MQIVAFITGRDGYAYERRTSRFAGGYTPLITLLPSPAALSPSTFEFHAIVVLQGCRLRLRSVSRSERKYDTVDLLT